MASFIVQHDRILAGISPGSQCQSRRSCPSAHPGKLSRGQCRSGARLPVSPGTQGHLWTARIAAVPGTDRWRCGLFESCAKRRHTASGVALDGAAADAHGGGDLSLGQIRVIAQHDRLALPLLVSRAAIWRGGFGPSMRTGGKSVGGGSFGGSGVAVAGGPVDAVPGRWRCFTSLRYSFRCTRSADIAAPTRKEYAPGRPWDLRQSASFAR
jgi:hypothetical protein